MAVKFPEQDTRLGGGSDLWDTPAARTVLLADYFPTSSGPQTFYKALGGTLTATAAAFKSFKSEAFSAAITMSGALTTRLLFIVSFGGTITAAGTVRKGTKRRLLASIPLFGNLRKGTKRRLLGAITAAGALRRSIRRRLQSSLTFTGVYSERTTTRKALLGQMTPQGAASGVKQGQAGGVVQSAARRFLTFLGR